MNFQDLRNQPETNMQIFGAVQQIFGIEFTQAKGTKKQGCYVTDDAGEKQKVTIYPGNNPVLEQFHVGQRLEFNLSARPNERKPGEFYYGGFWQCPNPQQTQQPPQGYQNSPTAQNSQYPPQQPPPPPQQAAQPPQQQSYQPPAQTPPQASNVSQHQQGEPQRNMTYAYEPEPRVQASIQRSVALEAASRVMLGKADVTAFIVLNMATTFQDWLSTGNVPMAQAPQPGEEDMPDFPPNDQV